VDKRGVVDNSAVQEAAAAGVVVVEEDDEEFDSDDFDSDFDSVLAGDEAVVLAFESRESVR